MLSPDPRRRDFTPPGVRPWAMLRSGALAASVLLSSVLGAAAVAQPTASGQTVTVQNPPAAPHSVLVFPQRDFVSASGYADGQTVSVQVIHPDGTVRSTARGLLPQDDPSTPQFDGIVEVNHPGGYCWDVFTPDIRPGDKVRVIDDLTG